MNGNVKAQKFMKIMKIMDEEVPTNLVPAVAVRRGGPVLVTMIGRKGCVDGISNQR